jgi:myo-inositol-1(or 4)-monophosphatase
MAWAEELSVAERAACAAGELVRMRFGGRLHVRSKGLRADLVTDADTASETLIRGALAKRFPDDVVLGEEGGVSGAGSSRRWIVDPLDGTTNFSHGYPFFCVSIALEVEGTLVVGAIFDPVRDELFVAERGGGARCNGTRLRVSQRTALRDALLTTGFPPINADAPPDLAALRELMRFGQAVRRDGSAALDLCYVAAGRTDGFWEARLHAWDVAAGALIVEEAGGRTSDFSGGKLALDGGEIIASNGAIHDEMVAILSAR